MQLYALGLNHHTAPLAVREQVAFDPLRLPQALVELTRGRPVREAAILSTCNRTELYCAAEATPSSAATGWPNTTSWRRRNISPYLYTLPSRDAVRHMFRVASGLDSMVLGEPQILGQMKQAARVAEDAGTLGTLLHKLFQRTFAVAKEVRSTTAIGANIVSMAAAHGASGRAHLRAFRRAEGAVHRRRRNDRTVRRALSPRSSRVHGDRQPHARARRSAGGSAFPATPCGSTRSASAWPNTTSSCPARQPAADHRPGHGRARMRRAPPADGDGRSGRAARHRAEVAKLDDVFLYTVDDLGPDRRVGSGVAREGAVVEAEASSIACRRTSCTGCRRARRCRPSARCATRRAHAPPRGRARAEAAGRGEDPQRVLEALSRGLTNKLMHGPTAALNQARAERAVELADLVAAPLSPASRE
jgi:glutamyl-tRNA reductase